MIFNDEIITDPILVNNPLTKRFVNIAPLLNLVNDDHDGNFKQMAKSIDGIIRHVSCTVFTDDVDILRHTNAIQMLYTLRDTIDNISEYSENAH